MTRIKTKGATKGAKNIWIKGMSFKMAFPDGNYLTEEDKILASVLCITYNSKLDRIHVNSSIRHGKDFVNLGVHHKGNIDSELKNTVINLMKENPQLSSRDVHIETGLSTYRLNRIYMVAKRELM